jgi:DNA-binding XRE family transcriptional regulator
VHTLESNKAPKPDESITQYLRRLRQILGISQRELASKAGVHPQSIGKLERGITSKLNQKTRNGLAYALAIPVEYLDAVCKGLAVTEIGALKFCPQCWTPGTAPDPLWTNLRSKYCFACGSQLRDRCSNCKELIQSLKFRFCPYCGIAYKS